MSVDTEAHEAEPLEPDPSEGETQGLEAQEVGAPNGETPDAERPESEAPEGELPEGEAPEAATAEAGPPEAEGEGPSRELKRAEAQPLPVVDRPPELRSGSVAPRVDALTAALRYPLLIIVPTLLLGAFGYFLAHRKPVTYKASAEVLLQQPPATDSAALPGVVQAELSLTPVYARELDFDPVLVPLARKLHTTPLDVANHLSATPIPSSPIIRVDATGRTAAAAVTLANGAATQLSKLVTSQATSTAGASGILHRYQSAVAAYQLARAHEQQLAQGHSPSDPAVVQATVAMQVAQLRQNMLGAAYQADVGMSQSTPTLNVFAFAGGATNDRNSNREIYVFVGIVAGLLIGLALATLLATRRALRGWRPA